MQLQRLQSSLQRAQQQAQLLSPQSSILPAAMRSHNHRQQHSLLWSCLGLQRLPQLMPQLKQAPSPPDSASPPGAADKAKLAGGGLEGLIGTPEMIKEAEAQKVVWARVRGFPHWPVRT